MKNSLWIILIVIILIIIGIFLVYPRNNVIKLPGIEVQEYEGKDLSSINDFRENSIRGPQYIDISNYQLEVSGLVENPRNYSYEEIIGKQNYEKYVRLNCVEGWSVDILWQGILFRDLLKEVKPKPEANTIIIYAYDGYSSQYPIEYFDKDIILAYKMNNLTIPPERGFPFMLVAEDKWGYKWIKWITKIELSDNSDYEGYWESRGYSKEGNLNESFIG